MGKKSLSYGIVYNNIIETISPQNKITFNGYNKTDEYIIIKRSGIYEIIYNLICTENFATGCASFYLTINDITITSYIGQNQLKPPEMIELLVLENTNICVTLYQHQSISMINNFALSVLNPDINQIIPINISMPNYSSVYIAIQSLVESVGQVKDNLNNIYSVANTLIANQVFYFDYTSNTTIENLIVSGFINSMSIEIVVYTGTNTLTSSLNTIVETSNQSNEFTLNLIAPYSTYGLVFVSSVPSTSPFIVLTGLKPILSNPLSNPTYLVGTSLINIGTTNIIGKIGRSNITAVALVLRPLSTIYNQTLNNTNLSIK